MKTTIAPEAGRASFRLTEIVSSAASTVKSWFTGTVCLTVATTATGAFLVAIATLNVPAIIVSGLTALLAVAAATSGIQNSTSDREGGEL